MIANQTPNWEGKKENEIENLEDPSTALYTFDPAKEWESPAVIQLTVCERLIFLDTWFTSLAIALRFYLLQIISTNLCSSGKNVMLQVLFFFPLFSSQGP